MSTSKKTNKLYDFLRSHKCAKGQIYTHTSIGKPKGAYRILDHEYSIFYDIYVDYVFKNKKKCYLTEKPDVLSPIKVDIDFKWEDKDLERIYTYNDHVISLVKLYMEQILRHFNIHDIKQLQAFVFEKEHAVKTGKSVNENKDGIHLMFPYISTEAFWEKKIRQGVLENCASVFDNLNKKLINKYTDVIDTAVIDRNNWQMFGSRKPNCSAYKLTHILSLPTPPDGLVSDSFHITVEDIKDIQLEELDINSLMKRTLVEILSIRNREESTNIKYEMTQKYKAELDTHSIDMIIKATNKKVSNKFVKSALSRSNKETIEMSIRFVDILERYRAESYKPWYELGLCLNHIHNHDDILLQKWIEFSKKIPKYRNTAEKECRKLWYKMEDGPIGIKTLRLWANMDNPSAYQLVLNDVLETQIFNSALGRECAGKHTHWDTALIVWKMFKDQFVCVSSKRKEWYRFKDHRWNKMDGNLGLKKKLSTEVFQQYKLVHEKLLKKSWEAGDDGHKKSEKVAKLMGDLKHANFKDKVLTESIEFFHSENGKFVKELNTINYLIGFDNGVYDLKKDHFREGHPEDKISLSTNINYVEFSHDHFDIKSIKKFMEQILPSEDVREYVLLCLASFLNGSTKEEKFQIWTGRGGNGKSVLIDMIHACFGEYADILPVTILTKLRPSATSANPELAKMVGKRVAVIQEPEGGTEINGGYLKELTGGDSLSARGLYADPFTFKPQFKMIMTCNELPKFPGADEGIWRRVRAVEFKSSFVDNPSGHWEDEQGNILSQDEHLENVKKELVDSWIPKNETYSEYPINRELKHIAQNDWKEPFMWYLLQYYKIYKEKGLEEPEEVLEYTKSYQKSCDKVLEFIEDYVEDTEEMESRILIGEFMREFKLWHREQYEDEKMPTRKVAQQRLERKWGLYYDKKKYSYPQRGWHYVKLKKFKADTECYIEEEEEDIASSGS